MTCWRCLQTTGLPSRQRVYTRGEHIGISLKSTSHHTTLVATSSRADSSRRALNFTHNDVRKAKSCNNDLLSMMRWRFDTCLPREIRLRAVASAAVVDLGDRCSSNAKITSHLPLYV